MKICVVCNKQILNPSNNQVVCGPECWKVRKREHNKAFQERRRIKKGQSLYANCSICNSEFFKGDGRGKHSLSCCSEKCERARSAIWAKAEIERRKAKGNICIVEGCKNIAVRTKMTLCENHFCQKRRTGGFEKKVYGRTADHGHYVRVLKSHVSNHPMASKKTKMLYEHRMVAYDSRNGICEPCFWCGQELSWNICVVDHFNEDKHDNRPENLLIACVRCNRARGAMLNFISRMKEESLPFFYEAIDAYRKKHGKFKNPTFLDQVVQDSRMEKVAPSSIETTAIV